LDPLAHGGPSAGERQGGELPGEGLLATKVYAPRPRANLVTRQRLLDLLHEGTRGKLTVVSAPAGFGKTTLLGEWGLRSGLPVGWLSLDSGDNDAARFFAHLVAALRSVEASIGDDETSRLRSNQPPTRANMTALGNEIAATPHDLALVLDDYHLVEDESVHAAFTFLLDYLPPQMHLVIATRTEPPLPLSRLLARGDLTRLTASDLRFTSEEAADFLGDAMGLDLSARHITALEERTEGWIAALQLAALSMRGREDVSGFVSAFAGTDRHILDYLAEEVLDRQTEDTRTFLLQTSILDRLSGPLCDAVTGRAQGQAMLEKVERRNLLMVPLDDQRRWYRYHHLFSQFLRQRLRAENPELVSELHQRASAWHEANGTESEAITHALAARDFERAAVLIERLEYSMLVRGESPIIETLIKTLPEELIRSRPRLYMTYAYSVLMADGRWDAAEAAVRDAEQMIGIGSDRLVEPWTVSPVDAIEDEERAVLAGKAATVRANIAYEGRGDLRSAIALNRRAVELYAGDHLRFARAVPAFNLSECLLDIGDLPAANQAIEEAIEIALSTESAAQVSWCRCLLGRLQTIQGRLSESMKTYEQILKLTAEHEEAGRLLDKGLANVRLGELSFEWDDLEAAARHLSEGIEQVLEWAGLGEATGSLLQISGTHDRLGRLEAVDQDAAHAVVPGYIALARVSQAQGNAEGATEALRKVERVAQNARLSPLWKDRAASWQEAWQARLWIAEGTLRAANRWALERNLKSTDDPAYSSELEYITLARLLLAQGKHQEAANLLRRLMDAAEVGGRRHTLIELVVLQALILQAQDDEPGALVALQRALTLAEPEGYIRTFADEGEPMADLLQRLLRVWRQERPEDVPLDYASRLLAALDVDMKAPSGTDVRDAATLILDPITGRELEVLRLLDSELSNREIAARLFVSLDTVKSHTRHLYAKLGVHNRHQAVRRAMDLKLL
jgi:LuxR family transcriptional regulator, maltose regulon positive regulatory protein